MLTSLQKTAMIAMYGQITEGFAAPKAARRPFA
jgi:hypothetical protein